MPTYTYKCRKCEHEFDVFHAISAKPRVKCEECGGASKKLLGTGAGIIFKGSGFYETDYKRKGSSTSASSSDTGKSTSESGKSDSSSSGSGSSSNSSSTSDAKAAAN